MSLTNTTLKGFIWAYSERFGKQALQLVIFIVLARILEPRAFGLIGMLTVFISVSQSLTDSGFGQALIQKKDVDERDYSSVFYINFIVSIGIYVLLFAMAPLVASFYDEPPLTNLIRVLGLRFIISSFSMVQIAKLTKEVNFKKLMIAKLPSTLLGGVVGVGAAYSDFGVWSLVFQQLADTLAYTVQIWIQAQWRPQLIIDFQRVKSLFDFGGKIMVTDILRQIYRDLYPIVIGRYFSAAQVGYFTQADKIKQLPVRNISNTVLRVTFPILAKIQDDEKRLKRAYKKILLMVMLLIAPLMCGGIMLAEPLFSFVLTDKWLPAVPYFQWLCVEGFFLPVSAYNLNILKVKGRSDLFLWLSVIKKVVESIGILIAIQYSVLALVVFKAIFGFVGYIINSHYSGKFINYNTLEQLFDISKIVFAALIMMGSIAFINSLLNVGDLTILFVGMLTGVLVYTSNIYLLDKKLLLDALQMVKKIKRNNI